MGEAKVEMWGRWNELWPMVGLSNWASCDSPTGQVVQEYNNTIQLQWQQH